MHRVVLSATSFVLLECASLLCWIGRAGRGGRGGGRGKKGAEEGVTLSQGRAGRGRGGGGFHT